MTTKTIEIDGRYIIIGIENDQIIAQFTEAPDPDPIKGTPPQGITDKVKLSTWLQSQGLKRGTPEYDVAFRKHGEGLPLENHPGFKNLE